MVYDGINWDLTARDLECSGNHLEWKIYNLAKDDIVWLRPSLPNSRKAPSTRNGR